MKLKAEKQWDWDKTLLQKLCYKYPFEVNNIVAQKCNFTLI